MICIKGAHKNLKPIFLLFAFIGLSAISLAQQDNHPSLPPVKTMTTSNAVPNILPQTALVKSGSGPALQKVALQSAPLKSSDGGGGATRLGHPVPTTAAANTEAKLPSDIPVKQTTVPQQLKSGAADSTGVKKN